MKYQLSLFLFICISSCTPSNKLDYNDDTEFAYEIQVLNDIFVDLTKGIGVTDGYPQKPIPPFPIKNKNGDTTAYDSTIYKLMLKNDEEKGEDYIVEPKSILIAINDSLYSFINEDVPYRSHLPSDDYISVFDYSRPKNKKYRKIDIARLTQTQSYKLMPASYCYKPETKLYNWIKSRDKNCKGKITISRIHFNKARTMRILETSYLRGQRSGMVGCTIYIRRINWT